MPPDSHSPLSMLSIFFLLALTNLSACGGGASQDTSAADVDNQLQKIISEKRLTGDPMGGLTIPSINDKTAQLGMLLFYSKSLGGDRDSACVSCHHPALGGGDNLSLPIGTEAIEPDQLGPGREQLISAAHYDGGPNVPRNAPTTFNLACWDQVMFHDGRVESLGKTPHANGADSLGISTADTPYDEADPLAGANLPQAQARFPTTSPEEMKGFNHGDKNNQQMRKFLAARIGNYDEGSGLLPNTDFWLEKFRDVYNSPAKTARQLITEQNITVLLGEYERSQNFTNTPWKAYVQGDPKAIPAAAKRGAALFFTETSTGGAGCANCHSGDFFTDEAFHNLAMPQIGRGKDSKDLDQDGDTSEDFGRYHATFIETDRYAFRTPTLLNVEVTGPWSHAGAYISLKAVIKHHLNPQQAIDNFDFSQLTQRGIQNLDKMKTNTQEAIDAPNFEGMNIRLSDAQLDDLIAFLKTLTDPCVKDRACLAQWIPDASVEADIDHLFAKDKHGNPI